MPDSLPAHRVLIDWISASAPVQSQDWNPHDYTLGLDTDLARHWGKPWEILRELVGTWEHGVGRAPYRRSARSAKGVTVFYSELLPHALIEISGRGCETLRAANLDTAFIGQAVDRITRIDLAVDLVTDVTPQQFVDAGVSGRFQSRGYHTSPDGETVYIGSRKSDRYCRVYRYNKPHPRHQYLRIEFVMKSENARIFVRTAQRYGWSYSLLASGLMTTFGFTHPVANLGGEAIPLNAYAPERREAKTVRWLIEQCASAFIRLAREGVIENPTEFVLTHFIEPLEGNDHDTA